MTASTSDKSTVVWDERPFWKPRDLALLVDVSPSQIYRLIETGVLEHVKVGERTIRVRGESVARYLGKQEPQLGERSLSERLDAFRSRTGYTPEDFVVAYRAEDIEDSAENHDDAMEAMALRAAVRGQTCAAGDGAQG